MQEDSLFGKRYQPIWWRLSICAENMRSLNDPLTKSMAGLSLERGIVFICTSTPCVGRRRQRNFYRLRDRVARVFDLGGSRISAHGLLIRSCTAPGGGRGSGAAGFSGAVRASTRTQ